MPSARTDRLLASSALRQPVPSLSGSQMPRTTSAMQSTIAATFTYPRSDRSRMPMSGKMSKIMPVQFTT